MTGEFLLLAAGSLVLIIAFGLWLVPKMAFLLPDPAHFDRELDHYPAPPPSLRTKRDVEPIHRGIERVAARPLPTALY